MKTRFATPISSASIRSEHATPRQDGSLRPTPFPLILHDRARSAARTHLTRAVVRTLTLVVADLAALALVYAVIIWIRDHAALGTTASELAYNVAPKGMFPRGQLITSLLLSLTVFGVYGAGDRRRDTGKLFCAAALAIALVFWQRMWMDFSLLSLVGAALCAGTLGSLLAIERYVTDRLVHRVRASREPVGRVLAIGGVDNVERMTTHGALRGAGAQVVGFLDLSSTPHPEALGGIWSLVDVIYESQVDTVIFAEQPDDDTFVELLHASDQAGCQVYALSCPYPPAGYTPAVVVRHGLPLIQLTRPSLLGPQLALKRVFDIVVSILGLIVLAPLFVAIAVAVKATSRGPILFRQQRVGLGGHFFSMYKFRSMVQGAEKLRGELTPRSMYPDHRMFKMQHDPRVTKLGLFLRRSSLDELPQFWNVLRGEMSLVGPRPPLPGEVELYEEHHYTRFDMKPGITGPWQVGGRSSIKDFEEVIRLETAYLRNWSIWKDFEILFRTVPVVFSMTGAH